MKQIAKITFESNISLIFDEYGVEIAHEASVEIVTDDEDFEEEVQAEEKCEQACEEEFIRFGKLLFTPSTYSPREMVNSKHFSKKV